MDFYDAIREVLMGQLCQRLFCTTNAGRRSYHRMWLKPEVGILQAEANWADDTGCLGTWFESQLTDEDLTATNWEVVKG